MTTYQATAGSTTMTETVKEEERDFSHDTLDDTDVGDIINVSELAEQSSAASKTLTLDADKAPRVSWQATARPVQGEDEYPFVICEAFRKNQLEDLLAQKLEENPGFEKKYKILAHRVLKTHVVEFEATAKIKE